MSDIIKNSKYAPGIASYGIKGQNGQTGPAGYSLYYSPYNISIDGDKVIIDENLKRCIKNNLFITDNESLNITKQMENRKYQINDMFLTKTGEIFKLTDLEFIKFERIMNLSDSLNGFIFDSSNNIIMNSNNKNIILGKNINVNDYKANSILNIKPDEYGNFISLISNNDSELLNIKYLNNDSILSFDNSKPVCINGSMYVEENDSTNDNIIINNKKYYKAVTYNNVQHNDNVFIYDKVNDILKINGECEYRYILNNDNNLQIKYHLSDDESITIENVNSYKLFEIYIHESEYVSKFIKIK